MSVDSKLKVLLIEDDEDDYILVKNYFSEIACSRCDLDWVDSYEDGLEALEHGRYDVTLLDYRLGRHNGLELLKEAMERDLRVPIILLTGQGDYDVDVEAMKAGAADYLVKGQINPDLLERSIRYAVARKEAQEELRKSEHRFRMLVETMNEGLGVQDEKGLFTYVNSKLCEMLGYSRDELIGRPVTSLMDASNLMVLEEEMKGRRSGERMSYEIELTTKGGHNILTIISSAPLYDEDGHFRGGIAVITELRGRSGRQGR